jgi:hypothetical protein
VISEVSYDPGLARSLAERTGAQRASFSQMAGGLGAPGYIASTQANIESLVKAVEASGAKGPSN